MTATSRLCPHGDDVPSLCPPCQTASGATTRRRSDVGPVFVARFESRCRRCGDEINLSDECRMVDGLAWCRPCADLEARRG
jgi:hypothetical protein